MREWWRRTVTREALRLRRDGRANLLWALRITVAATASFVVGLLFFPGTQPLLAPLTAMLVVQVTPVSLLASGLDRVVAVIAGVSLAVGFSAVVPLHWWSLGILIFVSISIGQLLRLRSNLIEVAISGMLVLGVGVLGAESAAWQRIAETLVGAAVGIAANLLFPPKPASADAGRAIDGLANAVSEVLSRAAEQLTEIVEQDLELLRPAARTWLDDARQITHDIPNVGQALIRAEQSRRLNVRAVGTADAGPGLRQGLEALEHSAVAVRSMFRALVDATYDAGWLDDETTSDVLLGLAQTLRELAAGVDAFGELVRDDAEPASRFSPSDLDTLHEALDGMHEARARLHDLLVSEVSPSRIELHAAVLSTVKRLLTEMDLDERVRRQVQLLRPSRPRRAYLGRPGSGVSSGSPVPPEPSPEAETQPLPVLRRDRRDRGDAGPR